MLNDQRLDHKAFGELVKTSVEQVVVQHFNNCPPELSARFGEIIKLPTSNGSVFALAYDLQNLPLFSLARPIALELSPAQLQLEQPQINDVIADFTWAKLFAYQEGANRRLIFNCAPQPPSLHSFAQKITPAELLFLTEQPLFFVHALQAVAQVADIDKVAKALILQISQHQSLNNNFFTNFYQQYSQLPGFNQRQARILFSQLQQLQQL